MSNTKDPVEIAHNEYHNSLVDITQEMIDSEYENFLSKLDNKDNDSEVLVIDSVVQYNEHINNILLAQSEQEILDSVREFRDMIKTNVVGEL